ncbi:MAG: PQQ-dependent sugar dehydrogenase, partial [Deltaproteobacteria bacterium]|nr:PQQ-dependent sugar dehydrogenase [Deltaproteobacteria bacterium]
MSRILATMSVAVVLGCGEVAVAQPQEPNFEQTPLATGLGAITDMTWATDQSNTLFVTVKGGALRVVRDGALQAANVATVSPVYTNSECGLLGVAVHPSFASNGFVYVFVTETSSTQRIYRYTVTESAGNLTGSSKTQIGPDLPTRGVNHDGGAIVIGPDNLIYFGVGNLANSNNVGGDGTAGEFTSLGSKIGRMDLNGNAVSTDPYYNAADGITAADYIFSRGWRNPYGLTFQPGTGALWVLEVGDSWEHIFISPL